MKAVDLNCDGKITIDEYLKTVLGEEWEVRTARTPRRRRGASVVDNFTKDDVSVLRQLFNNIVSGESDASGEEYLLGEISCNVLEVFYCVFAASLFPLSHCLRMPFHSLGSLSHGSFHTAQCISMPSIAEGCA